MILAMGILHRSSLSTNNDVFQFSPVLPGPGLNYLCHGLNNQVEVLRLYGSIFSLCIAG